ncbi:hypothetical protein [Deinococcus hohokamensis]|uniref:Fimbrial biogenesis outer membrane usher protein n=1 Tax=Deinococcus hohokamensis TaxID=309883 RepID=A0ABV9ICA3_9DEIO
MLRPSRRPRSGPRRPAARWLIRAGALLALGAAGLAGAADCDLPEELLGVRVGQVSRGTFVVRVQHEGERVLGVLVPPDVLRGSERAYVAAEVTCDGVAYVRLQPDLRLSYLQDTQELRVAPAFARLGQRVIDLRQALTRPEYPVVPSFGVDFGARASLSYALQGGQAAALGPAQAYVGVGGSRQGLTGYVGALYDRRGDQTSAVQLRATAQYVVNPELTLYAGYNAAPGVAQPEFTASDSLGVSATYHRNVERVAPRIDLQLENPSAITVYVNNVRLGQVEAPAGEISLLNVPLEAQAHNTVVLLIEDETGFRQKTIEVPAGASGLPGGGLVASVTLGRSAGVWAGSAAAQYAVSPSLGVAAQVRAGSNGALNVGAQVRLVGPVGAGLAGSAGVQVSRAAPTADEPSPPVQTSLSASADLVRGPLGASAALAVPISQFSASTLNLRASYNASPWFLSARVGSALTRDSWLAEAGVTRLINDRSSATLTASAFADGWRAQLSAQYRFSPKVQASAGLGAAPGTVSPRVSVVYQPDPSQALTVSADLGDVSASYALTRGVDLNAQVSTRGAAAQVRGALTYLDGRVQLVSGLSQRGLLVRIGVPGIPVLVGGAPGAVTNARGELLITQLPPGGPVLIRINPRDLPLGVNIGSVELEVLPATSGLTVVDWRENFKVSTFVRFRWTASEVAAAADLYLDGERIPLDDDGYGLVPQSAAARTGELRGGDNRRCAVQIGPAAEDVRCAPAP